jgi:hypothetical protein
MSTRQSRSELKARERATLERNAASVAYLRKRWRTLARQYPNRPGALTETDYLAANLPAMLGPRGKRMKNPRRNPRYRAGYRFGTHRFVSLAAAEKYFAAYGDSPADVKRKISEGSIALGPPPPKRGERVTVIPGEGRYQIEVIRTVDTGPRRRNPRGRARPLDRLVTRVRRHNPLPNAVRKLALRYRINLQRDDRGVYTIWRSDIPNSPRYFAQTASGARARIRQLGEWLNPPARALNPRRKRRRAARRRNPRSPLFKLLAQRRGGKRLVYLGGVKFAEKGRPVYFKTPEAAKIVAKLLRLQFPMLKRYAFAVTGA